MALRKKLRVNVHGEVIEADVDLTDDGSLRFSATVVAQWHGELLVHHTAWVDDERHALADATSWLRSHFETRFASVVPITGTKRAA